jgi:hypothetical protein
MTTFLESGFSRLNKKKIDFDSSMLLTSKMIKDKID